MSEGQRGHGVIYVCLGCGRISDEGGVCTASEHTFSDDDPPRFQPFIPVSKLEAEVEWLRKQAQSLIRTGPEVDTYLRAADHLARLLPDAEGESNGRT